ARQDEDRILMLDPEVESEYVTVEFRLSFLESIDKELKLLWPFVARVNGICLYDEYQIPDHLSQMLCGIGLRESWDVYIQRVSFLIRIQQMLFDIYHIFLPLKNPELPKFAPDLVDRAVQRIHEYLFEEMNLETLAKSFFVSKSNLNYLFRKKYNCSVHAYILQQRLLAARGKIQNGMSASDACHHCGFKEYSTFYRQYKKYFGISPKEEKLCNLTTF
ncbi:MAG: helix-turn-helix transcriptional regulator, partial [Clostridia bacterium]|nr:helix-turn-helix transcriptional regulator [Clostridia bacterium]